MIFLTCAWFKDKFFHLAFVIVIIIVFLVCEGCQSIRRKGTLVISQPKSTAHEKCKGSSHLWGHQLSVHSVCLRFHLRLSLSLNGNSVTKQSLNYHSAISEKSLTPFDQLDLNLKNDN